MAELDPAQIAEHLREQIRRRQIAPGATLNQKLLAAQLGISRIPVREALRMLGSEGLVVLKPGQIARVVELNRGDVAELYDLRLALEPPLASAIIDAASPADLRELAELAEAMEEATDRDRWSTLNFDFHSRMYALTDRPHTLRVILQVMSLVEPYSRLYVHLLANLERVSREHAAMIAGLRAGDATRLEELIREHLLGAKEGLLAELGLWPSAAPERRLRRLGGGGS